MKKIILNNLTFTVLISIVYLNSLTICQTTYIWVGSVNSSFSNGGNWSPYRQIGRTTDRLIFNNGQHNVVNGVNQVTFAQLVIKGNTSVTLEPGSGNARIIFIEGELNDSPEGGEKKVIADLKYSEYNIEEKVEDIATLKYREYALTEENPEMDLATLKYSEYNNPPVSGMGDLKVSSDPLDNPNNSNFYIENGSALRINASDPSLSILLKLNAKAEIYGTMILEGQIQNSLNSNDPFSIYFKPGSKIIQKCPGNLFNSTGAANAIVFENGSEIEIANSQALNPFALESPASKIILENGSKFIMTAPNSNALRFSGRNYSTLVINCSMVLNEIIVNDCNLKNIIVNQGSSLTINNLNNSNQMPALKISGDLTVNGSLIFPESNTNNLRILLEGTEVQSISGSGNTDFNTSLHDITISNNININKDIEVNCNVVHSSGALNCLEHTFTIYGNFISPFSLPVGVVIRNGDIKNRKNNEELPPGNIKQVTEAKLTPEPVPEEFSLSQNYPNPFNPETTIGYAIPLESMVTLRIYDVTGKEIMTLTDGIQKKGFYKKRFNGSELPSGVYFYRLIASNGNDNFTKSHKMILSK